MTTLLDLLEASPWPPVMDEPETLAERFATFHRENPHVYVELVRLARVLKSRGHKKVGIAMLFEQLRWQYAMTTSDMSGYKLNNSYRAHYARLIMEKETDLEGIFETRGN